MVHEELMTTAFYFKWGKNVGVGVQLCSFAALLLCDEENRAKIIGLKV